MPVVPFIHIRKLCPVLACSAVVAALGVSVTPSASAVPTPTPVRHLRVAALRPGEASMGWREAREAAQTASSAPARLASLSPNMQANSSSPAASGINGMDVSGWQRTVNWSYWRSHGKTFAYVKATEGKGFKNKYFGKQYYGSYAAGMFHGAYHFALPNRSSGYTQASYFVAHGGSWSRDGRTLPGVLDIEYNPYGRTCYGLSHRQMVAWIKSFNRRYTHLTGRDAVIYTTNGWWRQCTGNSTAFHRSNPLWIARYAKSVGTLPGNWSFYTFWQYSASPLDQDRFSSRRSRLVALAKG